MARKISIKKFNRIKELVTALTRETVALSRDEEGQYTNSDKRRKNMVRIDKQIKKLAKYDLGDIDFSEWEGFELLTRDFNMNGTNANLDFSIFTPEILYRAVKLQGCNIRNFDFVRVKHDDETFDAEYISQNPDDFLDTRVTDPKVRYRFQNGLLELEDIRNWDIEIKKTRVLSPGLRATVEEFGVAEFFELDFESIMEVYKLDESVIEYLRSRKRNENFRRSCKCEYK
ncbi:MAG: hypothetical protein FWC79_00180 [Oscillospiraceae bacterium]|nr:hypothetical protein [Oscillospiraceae bacterium]